MLTHLINFLEDQSGASFTEYALLAALVSLIIVSSLSIMGSSTSAAFTTTSGNVDQAAYVACVGAGGTPLACRNP